MKVVALTAVIACFVGASGGFLARSVIADRDMAEVKALHAQERQRYAEAAQAAEQKARQVEQERVEALGRIESEAAKRTQDLQADAAAARRAADSLRQHIARLAGQTASNPAATDSGEATTGPGLLLTDLFSRTLDRTVELAEYADRARTAGLACEAAYQALR